MKQFQFFLEWRRNFLKQLRKKITVTIVIDSRNGNNVHLHYLTRYNHIDVLKLIEMVYIYIKNEKSVFPLVQP